jgi:MFS family permease
VADGPGVLRADSLTRQAIRTPRAAAVAGIAFALLFATALVLVRLAVPNDPEEAGTWLSTEGKRDAVILALNLLPFAGIAFLWFIGVVRDRIGEGEDRLFATVFLGSGLLFIAMLFTAGAIAGGLVLTANEHPAPGVWSFGRRVSFTLLTVYAMRMAAVFAISTTTIATRLGLAPRWLTVLGLATGVVLLFGAGVVPWIEIIFPAWVLVFSINILVASFRSKNPAVRDSRARTN